MGPEVQLAPDAFPPIILLVEDDPDTRDMYSVFLESSGMWVSTAPDIRLAAAAVQELRPDVIVADLGFEAEVRALEFAHAVKQDPSTAHIPVVMLSGRVSNHAAQAHRQDADLFLLKPVLPDDLAGHLGTLIDRSHAVRARNEAAMQRGAALMQRSNELVAKSHALRAQPLVTTDRGCPSCTHPLQWVETCRVDGAEYDYYHWCQRGCGLHCYDRTGRRWITLAG